MVMGQHVLWLRERQKNPLVNVGGTLEVSAEMREGKDGRKSSDEMTCLCDMFLGCMRDPTGRAWLQSPIRIVLIISFVSQVIFAKSIPFCEFDVETRSRSPGSST